MLTAHLPSGYCLARAISRKVPHVYPAALLGAIFPDFDMFFFLFVDGQTIHHHRYWVHIPAFWVAISVLALPLLHYAGYLRTGLVFFAAIAMHLLLDSICGGIMWLWPWNDRLYEMVTIPAAYSNWILSFVLHWTFLLEIAVWSAAIILWRNRKGGSGLRPVVQSPET